MCRPMISSCRYPKRASAPGLKKVTFPSRLVAMMASGALSKSVLKYALVARTSSASSRSRTKWRFSCSIETLCFLHSMSLYAPNATIKSRMPAKFQILLLYFLTGPAMISLGEATARTTLWPPTSTGLKETSSTALPALSLGYWWSRWWAGPILSQGNPFEKTLFPISSEVFPECSLRGWYRIKPTSLIKNA